MSYTPVEEILDGCLPQMKESMNDVAQVLGERIRSNLAGWNKEHLAKCHELRVKIHDLEAVSRMEMKWAKEMEDTRRKADLTPAALVAEQDRDALMRAGDWKGAIDAQATANWLRATIREWR